MGLDKQRRADKPATGAQDSAGRCPHVRGKTRERESFSGDASAHRVLDGWNGGDQMAKGSVFAGRVGGNRVS